MAVMQRAGWRADAVRANAHSALSSAGWDEAHPVITQAMEYASRCVAVPLWYTSWDMGREPYLDAFYPPPSLVCAGIHSACMSCI